MDVSTTFRRELERLSYAAVSQVGGLPDLSETRRVCAGATVRTLATVFKARYLRSLRREAAEREARGSSCAMSELKPRRGRPKGSPTTVVGVRLPSALAAELDAEARERGLTPSQLLKEIIQETCEESRTEGAPGRDLERGEG